MPDYHDEGRRLRALATDRRTLVFYRRHAERRMSQRGMRKIDVERMLKAGCVVTIESDAEQRWTVRGRDTDGRPIEAVVMVNGG